MNRRRASHDADSHVRWLPDPWSPPPRALLAGEPADAGTNVGWTGSATQGPVASDPTKFLMAEPADVRYHWVQVRLDAIDVTEMRELVLDAWRMCVPKGVAAAYDSE